MNVQSVEQPGRCNGISQTASVGPASMLLSATVNGEPGSNVCNILNSDPWHFQVSLLFILYYYHHHLDLQHNIAIIVIEHLYLQTLPVQSEVYRELHPLW